MKGGSLASDYVKSLSFRPCVHKQHIKKYPVLRSSLKGINFYQTAGARKRKLSVYEKVVHHFQRPRTKFIHYLKFTNQRKIQVFSQMF